MNKILVILKGGEIESVEGLPDSFELKILNYDIDNLFDHKSLKGVHSKKGIYWQTLTYENPKDVVEKNDPSIFKSRMAYIEKYFACLKGKTVEAFGKNSRGFWGGNDKKVNFTISKVNVDPYAIEMLEEISMEGCYDPERDKTIYIHIEIYLKGYNAEKHGLIYTDPTFEKSIMKLVTAAGYNANSIDYTEQGMQGDNFVSMSIGIPLMPKVK